MSLRGQCGYLTIQCEPIAPCTTIYMYSSPHKKVPTTLEYYAGCTLEVAGALYTLLRRTNAAYYTVNYAAHYMHGELRGVLRGAAYYAAQRTMRYIRAAPQNFRARSSKPRLQSAGQV